jgi:hypothetical protein
MVSQICYFDSGYQRSSQSKVAGSNRSHPPRRNNCEFVMNFLLNFAPPSSIARLIHPSLLPAGHMKLSTDSSGTWFRRA